VTDIIDDASDVLKNINSSKPAQPVNQDSSSAKVTSLLGERPPLNISDFEASLTKQNTQIATESPRKPESARQQAMQKRERAAWGAGPSK